MSDTKAAEGAGRKDSLQAKVAEICLTWWRELNGLDSKTGKDIEGRPWGREAECEAALSWLYAREATLGVRFEREGCAASGYRQVRIPRGQAEGRSQGDITMSTVDFEGLLVVTEPARFVARLTEGIGRGRAFGCGLMLIRRA